MKLHKVAISIGLPLLTTGCGLLLDITLLPTAITSMIFGTDDVTMPLLPQPYQTRYIRGRATCERIKDAELSDKSLKITTYKAESIGCNTTIPYQLIAQNEAKNKLKGTQYYLRSDEYPGEIIQVSSVYQSLVTPEEYEEFRKRDEEARKKAEAERKKAEERKAAAEKAAKEAAEKAAKEAAEKVAKEKAAAKAEIEQIVANKNQTVIKKYKKPFCRPYKVVDLSNYNTTSKDYYGMTGGDYVDRERNCLFEGKFYVEDVYDSAVIAYTDKQVCLGYECFPRRKEDGPFYILKNKKDSDLMNDEYINGIFEFVGMENIMGKAMPKFKHVE